MDIRFMEEAEDKRANTQTSERKSRPYHGLRHRSPCAARGNGRIQKACLRALWALETASTPQILEWTCCGKLHRGDRLMRWDYWTGWRALRAIGAQQLHRSPARGRPWLWSLPFALPRTEEKMKSRIIAECYTQSER